MRTIWKYTLEITDRQSISLPEGAEVLHVGNQAESLCLWALVDPKAKLGPIRCFEIFGTGHPIPEDMGVSRKFLGTIIMQHGALVWHVFERL